MATTRFRGPVIQGKFNEAGQTGYNLENKTASFSNSTLTNIIRVSESMIIMSCGMGPESKVLESESTVQCKSQSQW